MKITIDRIEGEFAVCEIEIGKFINIDKSTLPNAKEGNVYDVILSEQGKVVSAKKDDKTANANKARAQSLFNKLKKK